MLKFNLLKSQILNTSSKVRNRFILHEKQILAIPVVFLLAESHPCYH